MLILSRKIDEKIVIGDNVSITIVEIRGDTVKLGISAPNDIRIFRGELIDAIRDSNVEASEVSPDTVESLIKKIKPK